MTKKNAPDVAQVPNPQRHRTDDNRHGITRRDDYSWLRDDNWQEVFRDPATLDADIRAHLEQENAYQSALTDGDEALRNSLFEEMKGRIKEDDTSVPMKHGPYAYGTSFKKGGQQPRFFRTKRDGGAQQIYLDGDAEADASPYFRIGGAAHSEAHDKLLWSFDDKGSEYYTLRVRDLTTGSDMDDMVTNTGGSGVWNRDGSGFFYTLLDDSHRPSRILFHSQGTDPANDATIHHETDPGFFMDVQGSRLNDWIFISIHDHETSEYRLLRSDSMDVDPVLVAARETGTLYDLEEGGDIFFILTNADGAKDFKIMTVPTDRPGRDNWQELIGHEPGRLILSILAFEHFLVRLERQDGLPRIVVHERATGNEHMISFDEEAYSLGLGGALEYHTDMLRFSYSSMTTPAQVYDYDMKTRERVLLKTQEVPSGHKATDYVTRRLMAPAPDGELVPVTVLYHRDTKLDGAAPCLLYGYGSYGISIPASFNTNCLSLVDRGFVYAIAHVRGGNDKGYGWYEDGKREKKTNSFQDFIAVARYLVQQEFTQHDRIVCQGGSAGGMLMGAVANMAPELFGGIIAEVPFVDVLTTMLDDTLPLTPPEWPEWGNPIESKDDYLNIAAYSPYDNIKAQNYPPILAVAGLTDPRVTYWEPAKWVAKLRALKTDDNPVLFKINMEAGHAGASGRFSRLEEVAYSYAFALRIAESKVNSTMRHATV